VIMLLRSRFITERYKRRVLARNSQRLVGVYLRKRWCLAWKYLTSLKDRISVRLVLLQNDVVHESPPAGRGRSFLGTEAAHMTVVGTK
jgi:hypothetical protein